MKNTLLSNIKRAAILTVSGGALLFQIGCSTGVVSSLNQYSGEAMYESAVEGNGDLLSFAPNIQSEVQKHLQNKEQEQVFMEFQQSLVRKMIDENPTFADEFYDKLHSQDREEINQALIEAGELLERELQQLVGEEKISAENVVHAVLAKEQLK